MAKSDQRTILLVEDNGDDVLLFKRALKKAGLSNPVYVVGTARAAIQYLKGQDQFADRSAHPFPSVLILDLKLPDSTGFNLLRSIRLQPELQALHCVILTGDDRLSLFQECYAFGGDSFLRKPCNHEDLRNLADGFAEHWLTRDQPPPS